MNSILNSRAKNITAIVFSALYAVMIVLNSNIKLVAFQNLRYAVNSVAMLLWSLSLPIFLIVFIALKYTETSFKKWILPIAFSLSLIKNAITLYSSFKSIILVAETEVHLLIWVELALSCLLFAGRVLMFLGTLDNFKLIALFKYGTLAYILLTVVSLITGFIYVGGFTYFQNIPAEYRVLSITPFLLSLTNILFYIGLFLLTTNKKEKV